MDAVTRYPLGRANQETTPANGGVERRLYCLRAAFTNGHVSGRSLHSETQRKGKREREQKLGAASCMQSRGEEREISRERDRELHREIEKRKRRTLMVESIELVEN
ncbi:unnamed protein product [Prunus armeniaca]|uniref:Uncharacterized protein n=1 Tax=Prunus armeniaca TaxID=36596 RepID=A0A6J5UUU0_PRUAR|nr:unnamed protein product [Prunus armeniaca]